MGSIFLAFNRNGRPVSEQALEPVLACLAGLGPDGVVACRHDAVGLVQANLFSTPEDEGFPLPAEITAHGHGIAIAFDGRLDNREALLAELQGSAAHPYFPIDASSPDARLIAAAYLHRGEACCERLRGPAALVIADYRRRRVLLYRDPLGQRPLFYHLHPDRLRAASEPASLLTQADVSADTDAVWLSSHFSASVGPPGRTVFSSVREVLPGERLLIGSQTLTRHRPTLTISGRLIHYRRSADYADHFLELHRRAVAVCLRSNTRVGVMLSGGMDSTPLAATAEELRRKAGSPTPIGIYSWSLSRFPDADESQAIGECAAFLGLPLRLVDGSDHWPLSQPDSWPVNPNTPLGNGFQRLQADVYREARADGCGVLLHGGFGDYLYPNVDGFLLDMWHDRRYRSLLGELGWLLAQPRFYQIVAGMAMRRSARWLRRQVEAPPRRPWLTAEAIRLLEPEPVWPPESAQHHRPAQYRELLGLKHARTFITEDYFTAQYGVDRRSPYHNLEVIDFMLSIPTYECLRRGYTKLVMRNAMQGRLPERIRVAPRGGVLSGFFRHGLNQSRGWIGRLLFEPPGEWSRFVDKAWLKRQLDRTEPDSTADWILWQCISFELWQRKLASNMPV